MTNNDYYMAAGLMLLVGGAIIASTVVGIRDLIKTLRGETDWFEGNIAGGTVLVLWTIFLIFPVAYGIGFLFINISEALGIIHVPQ